MCEIVTWVIAGDCIHVVTLPFEYTHSDMLLMSIIRFYGESVRASATLHALPDAEVQWVAARLTPIKESTSYVLATHLLPEPLHGPGDSLRNNRCSGDFVTTFMVEDPAAVFIGKVSQLNGCWIPRVFDPVDMDRGYVDLQTVWEPGEVQPKNIAGIIREIGVGNIVLQDLCLVPKSSALGVSSSLHECLDFCCGRASDFVKLLPRDVVDSPSFL
jgi:hypothetical protein